MYPCVQVNSFEAPPPDTMGTRRRSGWYKEGKSGSPHRGSDQEWGSALQLAGLREKDHGNTHDARDALAAHGAPNHMRPLSEDGREGSSKVVLLSYVSTSTTRPQSASRALHLVRPNSDNTDRRPHSAGRVRASAERTDTKTRTYGGAHNYTGNSINNTGNKTSSVKDHDSFTRSNGGRNRSRGQSLTSPPRSLYEGTIFYLLHSCIIYTSFSVATHDFTLKIHILHLVGTQTTYTSIVPDIVTHTDLPPLLGTCKTMRRSASWTSRSSPATLMYVNIP